MKERPILFNGAMVRAILDGSKTQTRRVVKKFPPRLIIPRAITGDGPFSHVVAPRGEFEAHLNQYGAVSVVAWNGEKLGLRPGEYHWVCPFGFPGDRLWVRETFCTDWADATIYRADGGSAIAAGYESEPKWRPSIHMPRRESRINLEIVRTRVERLNSISQEDAAQEGFKSAFGPGMFYRAFDSYWDSLADEETKWSKNPWVWSIEFKRVNP